MGSLSSARDGGTRCDQEAWSFLRLQEAEKVHEEARKAIESARAGLALLNGTGTKSKRFCKKKAREATEKALAKAQDSESEAREAEEASEVNNNSMKASFLDDLEKAEQAQSTGRNGSGHGFSPRN
jgi:hypothetical protein